MRATATPAGLARLAGQAGLQGCRPHYSAKRQRPSLIPSMRKERRASNPVTKRGQQGCLVCIAPRVRASAPSHARCLPTATIPFFRQKVTRRWWRGGGGLAWRTATIESTHRVGDEERERDEVGPSNRPRLVVWRTTCWRQLRRILKEPLNSKRFPIE